MHENLVFPKKRQIKHATMSSIVEQGKRKIPFASETLQNILPRQTERCVHKSSYFWYSHAPKQKHVHSETTIEASQDALNTSFPEESTNKTCYDELCSRTKKQNTHSQKKHFKTTCRVHTIDVYIRVRTSGKARSKTICVHTKHVN